MFPRKTRRCCRKRRLESYTDWRVVFRKGEPLLDISQVVLAKKMDRKRNSCTKVHEVCPDTSGTTIAGYLVRNSAKGDHTYKFLV